MTIFRAIIPALWLAFAIYWGISALGAKRNLGITPWWRQSLLRGGFVLRYSTEDVEDALPPGEGAFLACSFWLVDVYILQERFDDAERLFRRLVGLSNDLGLLSEEYDPREKRLVGNFPQAFSHLALINSAYNLTDARKPLHQRTHDDDTPVKPVAARAEAETG